MFVLQLIPDSHSQAGSETRNKPVNAVATLVLL